MAAGVTRSPSNPAAAAIKRKSGVEILREEVQKRVRKTHKIVLSLLAQLTIGLDNGAQKSLRDKILLPIEKISFEKIRGWNLLMRHTYLKVCRFIQGQKGRINGFSSIHLTYLITQIDKVKPPAWQIFFDDVDVRSWERKLDEIRLITAPVERAHQPGVFGYYDHKNVLVTLTRLGFYKRALAICETYNPYMRLTAKSQIIHTLLQVKEFEVAISLTRNLKCVYTSIEVASNLIHAGDIRHALGLLKVVSEEEKKSLDLKQNRLSDAIEGKLCPEEVQRAFMFNPIMHINNLIKILLFLISLRKSGDVRGVREDSEDYYSQSSNKLIISHAKLDMLLSQTKALLSARNAPLEHRQAPRLARIEEDDEKAAAGQDELKEPEKEDLDVMRRSASIPEDSREGIIDALIDFGDCGGAIRQANRILSKEKRSLQYHKIISALVLKSDFEGAAELINRILEEEEYCCSLFRKILTTAREKKLEDQRLFLLFKKIENETIQIELGLEIQTIIAAERGEAAGLAFITAILGSQNHKSNAAGKDPNECSLI